MAFQLLAIVTVLSLPALSQASQRRHLTASSASCACVCSGTHEGYIGGVDAQYACTSGACAQNFQSCSGSNVTAHFSDGSQPTGAISGRITRTNAQPLNCEAAILLSGCAYTYQFSVVNGFIQFISTNGDLCPAGSAQQSITYKAQDKLAAGFFTGNQNYSSFTFTRAGDRLTMNVNQGCLQTYQVTSGGPLLGLKPPGGSCFPGSATVQTPEGLKTMADLRVGDKALAITAGGALSFQTVFMFTHQAGDSRSEFITLSTAAGRVVSVTPGHYLWVTKALVNSSLLTAVKHQRSIWRLLTNLSSHNLQGQGAAIVRAADVKLGDALWWLSHDTGKLERTRVTAVTDGEDIGLYNPHTISGSLMVDDIAALSFTDTLPPSMSAHTVATAPGALLYRLLPSDNIAGRFNAWVLNSLSQWGIGG